jgi:hypothetical protein
MSSVRSTRSRAAGASWRALVAVSVLAAPLTVASSARVEQIPLPAALDVYLTQNAGLKPADRSALVAGRPVTRVLDADPDAEVAVMGAVWVAAPSSKYIDRVRDIERFEQGGAFRVTRRISDPPSIEDFAQLRIPDEDFDDLQRCRVGDCELKLSSGALQVLQTTIDWKSPSARDDATAMFRRLALDYVVGYREGGNAKLAVYRDKDHPTFVASEFQSMIDRLPTLAAALPDLKRYLLDYPRASLPNSTEFLYWQETQFGLKPTIRISHLVIHERPEQTVVASKMLYASHYFWTALELRVLVPDPARGPGFWLVTVNRSRSDGLSGFAGRLIRRRVRSEVQAGTLASLSATKAKLEAASKQ